MKLKEALKLAAEYEDWVFADKQPRWCRGHGRRFPDEVDRRKLVFMEVAKLFVSHGPDFLALLKLVIDSKGKLSAKDLARVVKLNQRVQEMK